MNREQLQSTLTVAKHMAAGALTLIVGAFIIWAVSNGDVLYKALRYPEAVRQMQVDVTISSNFISPLVNNN